MSSTDRFFIEVESSQLCEKGQICSGDICIQRRHNNRTIVVLADGAGSGVRANIIAGVIGSMAINYTLTDEPARRAAKTIIKTFPIDESHKRHATFTILDIHQNGEVRVVEHENPAYMIFRAGMAVAPVRERIKVESSATAKLYFSTFTAEPEDRIVLLSDGVTNSGVLTRRLPNGWGSDGVTSHCLELIDAQPTISAYDICRSVIARAEINDLFAPKNDMTCAAIYFRQPRKIMVCSGPPFKEQKDKILADMVLTYDGTKLVCGGTTAQIISRESGREISVDLKRDPAGLPPTSTMQGVDLITEGVLTMSKVKSLLEKSPTADITQPGTDGTVARMLLNHDIIEFVVGTRINPVHQDPSLPVELELRRNLIKDLARVLETKFMKQIKIQYI